MWLVLFLLLTAPAVAVELPSACAPGEPYEVCQIEVQRNNYANDAARAGAEVNRMQDKLATKDKEASDLAEYWKRYVAGIEEQRQEAEKAMNERSARAAEAARRR